MGGFVAGSSQAGGPERFAIVDWGDEHVLYDGLTGACHLLSALAGEVFKLLLTHGGGPLDVRQIHRLLSDGDEVLPDADANDELDALDALLGGMREAGLVAELAT